MESLLDYFSNISAHHRAILIVGGLTIFWIIEGMIPLVKFKYNKWRHAIPNLFFNLTLMLVNFPLAFMLLKTADWVKENDFGIINWFPEMPLGLYAFLGVFLLDFIGAYLPHVIEHKVKPLWMVHLVHHTDHKVDTTTANRHHPIESVIRFVFTLVGVFLVGTPIGIVFLYQTVSVLATQFSHANISLPKKIDNSLSYFLVSPDMHKVHHHYRMPYTDSNYGNIFSVWDRLFGTFKRLDTEKINYGVDVFPDERRNSNIKDLLIQPFQKYDKPTYEPQAHKRK